MFINHTHQTYELLPKWSNFVFANLVAYGVHLGHSVFSSLKFCAWMIKGQRKGIFLIDLFKFVYMFRAGYYALEIAIRGRNPVWFINLDKTSSLLVKFPALECGEFWVVENWIRGMISNYFTVKRSLAKTTSKPFPAWNAKTFLKSSSFSHWGFTRHSWPRLVFVSNVMRSYGPCHEAHRLKIPSLGIVDTNTAHSLVSIAIPGNDEAATAVVFYNCLVSTFILYMKYSFIHNWYMGCLNEKTFTFDKWWGYFPRKKSLLLRPNILSFHFDQLRYMIGGFEAQFLQDIWQIRSFEAVRSLTKAIIELPRVSIINFYKSRAQFFKSLKASWTINVLGMSFLRPRLRRWFRKANILRSSKYTPLKERNLEMLLRLPRWKRRFFFRIARRLRRSRQPYKSYNFFYKFFGLASLFSFFKSNWLFSPRLLRSVKTRNWWKRSHVRFPWFKNNFNARRFLPRTYGKFYFRPRRQINLRSKLMGEFANPSSSFGFGHYKRFHQFPREWSKSLWLVRYINSLGTRAPRAFGSVLRLNHRRGRSYSYHSLEPSAVRISSFDTSSLRKYGIKLNKDNKRFFFFKKLVAPNYSSSSSNLLFVLRKISANFRLLCWGEQRFKYLLSLDHFDFFCSNVDFHYRTCFLRPKRALRSRSASRVHKLFLMKSFFYFKYV